LIINDVHSELHIGHSAAPHGHLTFEIASVATAIITMNGVCRQRAMVFDCAVAQVHPEQQDCCACLIGPRVCGGHGAVLHCSAEIVNRFFLVLALG
jgi:carbonic anhydrase/acetyltransferase-like protein (isoleucine patch superfamily)